MRLSVIGTKKFHRYKGRNGKKTARRHKRQIWIFKAVILINNFRILKKSQLGNGWRNSVPSLFVLGFAAKRTESEGYRQTDEASERGKREA